MQKADGIMTPKKHSCPEYNKACESCEYATRLVDRHTVLCSRNGIVSAGDICRRFLYDPLKRVPAPPMIPPEVDPRELQL